MYIVGTMLKPKVTLIIPVYNGANYLKYAIDSALKQTYKNLEIIVVNDGSSDNGESEKIAKSYGKKIRYIYKENGGVSSALNLAIEKMTGEYFSWLSHDDTYEPNKIEVEVDYLLKNELLQQKVIIYSDYFLIDVHGKLLSKAIKNHEELVQKPEYALLKGNINGLSLLIPKSAFDEYGGFDVSLKATQDYELWRKMARTYDLIHIPELLVSTRIHAKQVTNTSPKVKTEGNELYLGLIHDVSKKRRIELEGSEYCFFEELADFYKDTPFDEAEKYCRDRMREILEAAKKETSKYKVSVIIPFYNNPSETIRALKSVVNQTHKNTEILLVDDGSKTNTDEIKEYIKNKDTVRLIRLAKNSGVSAARNRGIAEASGEYIALLDSDDEFTPDKIKTQLAYMIASKAPMSHTSYNRNMDGEITMMHSGTDKGHCERKLMYSCPIATPTVMLDAQWLKTSGLKFNESIGIGEDTTFWLQAAKNNYIIGIDKPLTIVHAHNGSHAYDVSKQIVGFKNIIRFLLNDEHYSKYDKEISLLMRPYIDFVDSLSPDDNFIDDVLKNYNNRVSRSVAKFMYFTKHEGLVHAINLSARKVKKKALGK
jgi:glycosyltransferase involved in cell wall biosynthesis